MLGRVREEAKESKPQPMLMNDFLPPLVSRGSPLLSVIEVSTISHFLPALHPTSSEGTRHLLVATGQESAHRRSESVVPSQNRLCVYQTLYYIIV